MVVAVGLWARYLSYPGHGAILRSGLIRGFLVAPLKGKDAMWFTAIAQHGYGPNLYRTAFFPLYPLMLRAVGVLLGHDYWVAGIVVSLACYAGAMFVLYRLTAEEYDARTGAITVVLISVFPTAFVFNFIYSESLFLLLGVLAFYCARHEKWAIAGVAGFLAVLTRSTGVALFLPLLVMFAKQRNWTWRTDQSSLAGRRAGRVDAPDSGGAGRVHGVPLGPLRRPASLLQG